MTTLTLAALLGASALTHSWDDYTTAYETAVRSERELLVVVSAQWCGACRKLRSQVLPDPRLQPLLDRYARTVVDVDRQPQLAEALGAKGSIPLVIAYHKTPEGWVRREVRGYQSSEKLARFLRPPTDLAARQPATRRSLAETARAHREPATAAGDFDADAPDQGTTVKVQLLGILYDEPTQTAAGTASLDRQAPQTTATGNPRR